MLWCWGVGTSVGRHFLTHFPCPFGRKDTERRPNSTTGFRMDLGRPDWVLAAVGVLDPLECWTLLECWTVGLLESRMGARFLCICRAGLGAKSEGDDRI